MQERVWRETRPRLIVLGCELAVIGVFAFGMHGSVHLGPPPPYRPPDAGYLPPYEAWLTDRQPETNSVKGWVWNHTDDNCATVVVWVDSVNGRGHIYIGALPSGAWTYWSAEVRDVNDAPMLLADHLMLSADCYETNPLRTARARPE